MTWMLDAHAGQILCGLYKQHDRDRWKTWLRYGSVVLFAGIASGGAFVKLRPPSAPIAPVATEIAVKPGTAVAGRRWCRSTSPDTPFRTPRPSIGLAGW